MFRFRFGSVLLAIAFAAAPSVSFAAVSSGVRDFVVTAYYSPLSGQCCYVRGGLSADRELNGNGVQAADGTPVFPGLAAAPASYPYGTRVELPGIGVFEVHDRGGAIRELDTGGHRIDIWVGAGEEGLARALAFGVRRVQGTVYLPEDAQPAMEFSLTSLAAPPEQLAQYAVFLGRLPGLRITQGDRSYSALLFQEALRALGYLRRTVTGFFGPETRTAFARFLQDFRLSEPAHDLSDRAASFLAAALARQEAPPPLSAVTEQTSSRASITAAQRLMRYLGYYRGRTDGVYGEGLSAAVLRFQLEQGIISQETESGAGRIGPRTLRALTDEWNRRLTAARAERELMLLRVDRVLAERGAYVERFLSEGDNGPTVRLLQEQLAERGFFPLKEVNGNFGPLTQAAVLAFQRDRDIVQSGAADGAGVFGPRTLVALRREEQMEAYGRVRARGWGAL